MMKRGRNLPISKDCATFAAVFEVISQRIYKIMCSVHIYTGITAGQKRANFSASFNTHCLVVSQEFAISHTHTHNVRTYCSVTLFSFLLRAREASATPISKGLFGVPFASLFVPAARGDERRMNRIFPICFIYKFSLCYEKKSSQRSSLQLAPNSNHLFATGGGPTGCQSPGATRRGRWWNRSCQSCTRG